MPRCDGNHPATRRRHHRPMHSGRKGRGLDRKLKEEKKLMGESVHPPRREHRDARLVSTLVA